MYNYNGIADELVSAIRKKLDYQKYMTPVNFNDENCLFMEKYKSGIIYNPQYKYNYIESKELDKMFDNIEEILPYISDKILLEIIDMLKVEIQMYCSLGDNELFTDYATAIYGKPDCKYKLIAEKEIIDKISEQNEDMRYGAEDLKQYFLKRLNAYGFKWKIIQKKNMASRVSVEPDNKEIYINSSKFFSKKDIKRLIVHEIDTHVLRSENGFKREYLFYSSDTPRTLKDEEGLALYNERCNNVSDSFSQKLYAARYLCCLNIDKSFHEMFQMLKDYGCVDELAIYVVSRIKRGMSDTALSGGFIKDYVYFQGQHEICNAIRNEKEIYLKMYYGNISIKDIYYLQEDINAAFKNNIIQLPLKVDIL